MAVLTGGSTISSALGDFSTVITSVVGVITDNAILFTMFAGGLLVVGAKVFSKIKKAASK